MPPIKGGHLICALYKHCFTAPRPCADVRFLPNHLVLPLFLSAVLQACQAAKGLDVYGGLTAALQELVTPGVEVGQEDAAQPMDMDVDLSGVRAFQSCCEEDVAGRDLHALSESQETPLKLLCHTLLSNPPVLHRDWPCPIAGGYAAQPVLFWGVDFGLSVC